MQEEIRLFFQLHWENMFCILEEGKALVERTKNAGYHCYVLSNYNEEAFAYTEKKYREVFQLFDGKVISGRVRMMKPDSKIYEYLLQKYQLKKEECVFFDDTKKNVDASNAYGISSFLYTDSEKAWCDLQSLI